jgi:hypothetical protein
VSPLEGVAAHGSSREGKVFPHPISHFNSARILIRIEGDAEL